MNVNPRNSTKNSYFQLFKMETSYCKGIISRWEEKRGQSFQITFTFLLRSLSKKERFYSSHFENNKHGSMRAQSSSKIVKFEQNIRFSSFWWGSKSIGLQTANRMLFVVQNVTDSFCNLFIHNKLWTLVRLFLSFRSVLAKTSYFDVVLALVVWSLLLVMAWWRWMRTENSHLHAAKYWFLN